MDAGRERPRHDAARAVHVAGARAGRAPRSAQAIDRVITRGWFILGPEVEAFEAEFAAASARAHAVASATGTDALALTLRAMGIGPGDEVITSPLSAAFSALAIMMAGATPVFADIDPDRLTLDPAAADAAVTPRTAAIMPVHLYGQPADMPALAAVARRHNLAIVEDACQAHFATCDGTAGRHVRRGAARSASIRRRTSARSATAARSSPNDAALAAKLRRLRNGGQGDKYQHLEFGVNSRLDDMQAAVLRARLPLMPAWTARRRALAAALSPGARGRRRHRAAGVRRRARLPPVSGAHAASATAFQAHLAEPRRRHARALSDLAAAPAGARPPTRTRRARSPIAWRARSVRCRSIRTCRTPISAFVADAVRHFRAAALDAAMPRDARSCSASSAPWSSGTCPAR